MELNEQHDAMLPEGEAVPAAEGWLARQTEEVQAYIKKMRDKEAKLRLKTGIEDKDNEIAMLKRAIAERDEKENLGQLETKNLLERAQNEKSDLEIKIKTLSDELEAYRGQYETERKELLARLPPDEREIFANLAKPQLLRILEKSTRPENSAGARNAQADWQDVMKISPEEWAQMSAENPEQYKILKSKHLKLLRGRN